jgi:hypothetical protein
MNSRRTLEIAVFSLIATLVCFSAFATTVDELADIETKLNQLLETDFEIMLYTTKNEENAFVDGRETRPGRPAVHVFAGTLKSTTPAAMVGVLCHEWWHWLGGHLTSGPQYDNPVDALLAKWSGEYARNSFKIEQNNEKEADIFAGVCMRMYSDEFEPVNPQDLVIWLKAGEVKSKKNLEAMLAEKAYELTVREMETLAYQGYSLSEEDAAALYRQIVSTLRDNIEIPADVHGSIAERASYIAIGWDDPQRALSLLENRE